MSSLNKVMLIGHLGRDPETRTMQNGNKVCNLSIATSEKWTDKHSGEKRERTEWHRVVCFNDHLVPVMERYLRKGSKVYIEGKLQTRKWQDQSGQDRYSTEIVMQGFDGKLVMLGEPGGRGGDAGTTDYEQGGAPPQQQQTGGRQQDLDDEIPF